MPSPRQRISASTSRSELADALVAVRSRFALPDGFPAEVTAAAEAAAASVALPADDRTDIGLITIDPEGSTDLDQALFLERRGSGYLVYYAIADVPAFVEPDGPIDDEARRRGQTIYLPDGRVPLHPPVLSEGAASLLPNQTRSAYLWEFDLDGTGAVVATRLSRASVRSLAQFDYVGVQAQIDDGSAPETLLLLREVGLARIALERERGGASLNLPDEEVVRSNGGYTLERRMPLPAEDWNAQLSLMTGMAAAEIMIAGGVGILRTMPAASDEATRVFRAETTALGLPWPDGMPYGQYLRSLDRADPRALAVLQAASRLFRGAGYRAFDGEVPADRIQAAVGAPYAHTTAPLRRLVDRWTLVVCDALVNETPIPDWARSSLPMLPRLMDDSSRRTNTAVNAALDAVTAAVLSGLVGTEFEAAVLAADDDSAVLQLTEPPVTVTCPVTKPVVVGSLVTARLVSTDIGAGSVLFELG
jgi:exoribonuclease R